MDRLTCKLCKKRKSKNEFAKRFHETGKYLGGKAVCNECERARQIKNIYKNPRNYIASRHHDMCQRAKKYDISLDEAIDTDFLVDLFKQQDGRCALSNLPMTWIHEGLASNHGSRRGTNLSVDRVNPSEGYQPGNVRLVCDRVNKLKSNMLDGDLYFWCSILTKAFSGL